MGKAKRKPKPSMPYWYCLDTDGCWFCLYAISQRKCNSCGTLKRAAKKLLPKKYKGRHDEPRIEVI